MRSLTLAGCLLLMAAPPAAAQAWTYARSDHFEVYTTGGDRRAHEALASFERIRAFFLQVLNLAPPANPPTRIVVFSSERQYAPYRARAGMRAYYMSDAGRDYIVMASLDPDSQPIAIHEYVHLLVRYSGNVLPLWLNEGLAEFYSTMRAAGDGMDVGIVSVNRLRQLTGRARLMDLARLFAVTTRSAEYTTSDHAGLFYSQSWALTHMIHTDSRYRSGTGRFMALVGSGTPSDAAFAQVYGRTLDEVSRDLHEHVRRTRHAHFRIDYRHPPPGPQVPTRAVDRFEADLVTTTLLANQPGRAASARAAFERLAAQRPDDLTLHESRAFFELRSAGPPAALPHLRRAVELGSTHATIYRLLAGLEPQRAGELLSRASELSPGDPRVMRVSARELPELLEALVEQIEAASGGAGSAAPLRALVEDLIRAQQAAEDESRRAGAAQDGPGAASPPAAPGVGGSRAPSVLTATGLLRAMVCGGDAPVLEVATSEGLLRFRLDDPLRVQVLGASGDTIELQCGPQGDVPVRIGYLPVSDVGADTIGSVRVLDYRSP